MTVNQVSGCNLTCIAADASPVVNCLCRGCHRNGTFGNIKVFRKGGVITKLSYDTTGTHFYITLINQCIRATTRDSYLRHNGCSRIFVCATTCKCHRGRGILLQHGQRSYGFLPCVVCADIIIAAVIDDCRLHVQVIAACRQGCEGRFLSAAIAQSDATQHVTGHLADHTDEVERLKRSVASDYGLVFRLDNDSTLSYRKCLVEVATIIALQADGHRCCSCIDITSIRYCIILAFLQHLRDRVLAVFYNRFRSVLLTVVDHVTYILNGEVSLVAGIRLLVDGHRSIIIGNGIVTRNVIVRAIANSCQRWCYNDICSRIGRCWGQFDTAQGMTVNQACHCDIVDGVSADCLAVCDGCQGISSHRQGFRCDGEVLYHISAVGAFQHYECPRRIGTSLHVVLIADIVVGAGSQCRAAILHGDSRSLCRAVVSLVGDIVNGDVRVGIRSCNGQRTCLICNGIVRSHVGLSSHNPCTTGSDTRRIIAGSRIGGTHRSALQRMAADKTCCRCHTVTSADYLTYEDCLVLGLHGDRTLLDGIGTDHCSLVVAFHDERHTGIAAGINVVGIAGGIVGGGNGLCAVLYHKARWLFRRTVINRRPRHDGNLGRSSSNYLGGNGQCAHLLLACHIGAGRFGSGNHCVGANTHSLFQFLVGAVDIYQLIVAGWDGDIVISLDGHVGDDGCSCVGSVYIVANSGSSHLQSQRQHVQRTHLNRCGQGIALAIDKHVVVTHGRQ